MLETMQEETKIYIGEYGPIVVGNYGTPTYGSIIRFTRSMHHYHINYVAEAYGRIANEKPVTGRHILRMEQTDTFFPKDPNRRWVLAKLLNVPPVLLAYLGLDPLPIKENDKRKSNIPAPPKFVDIEEYYATLRHYQMNGYSTTVEETIDDMKERINHLHDTVLYVKPSAKPDIIRLLCGYQFVIASIAQDQGCYKAAKGYRTNAITLAKEGKLEDLLLIGLTKRQIFFGEIGDYAAALRDYEMTLKLKHPSVSHMRGKILTIAAHSVASLAQDNSSISTALHYSDQAAGMIKSVAEEDILFSTSFDWERYLIDRAEMLMASPIRNLRSPAKAQECLDEAARQRTTTSERAKNWRQANRNLVQAKIYYDQNYYPIAATTAENVLDMSQKLHTTTYVNDVANLLSLIKERCPQELEVVSLELELMKVQQPHLFN